MFTDLLVSLLLLIGGSFALIGSIGLIRLPEFFMRLHAPTKATTLGIGAIVIASLVHVSARQGHLSLAEIAISAFLFITAPIVAHLVAKAAGSRRRD